MIKQLIEPGSIRHAWQHKDSATPFDCTQTVTLIDYSIVPSWIAGCMLLITCSRALRAKGDPASGPLNVRPKDVRLLATILQTYLANQSEIQTL